MRFRIGSVALAFFVLLSGVALAAPNSNLKKAKPAEPAAKPEQAVSAPGDAEKPQEAAPMTPEALTAMAAERVQSLPLRARIAQLMLITMGGKSGPDHDDRLMLETYTPAGVYIPYLGPSEAALYAKDLRVFEAKTGVPIWTACNVFMVFREQAELARQFTDMRAPLQIPSLLSLAATRDPVAVKDEAEVVSIFLGAMGFNLHLGPSLDMPPALSDAKGNIQMLGSDTAFSGEAGTVFVQTLASHGILCVPTGFPGGEMNRVGKTAPVLLTPASRVAAEDAAPFAALIQKGAVAIHTGTALVPTLDDTGAPACASEKVMRGLLRNQLGFKGITFAGPMDAPHIAEQGPAVAAAVQAFASGADVLFWNVPGRHVARVVEEVAKAVEDGALEEGTINGALLRVLSVKFRAGVGQVATPGKGAADKVNEDKHHAETMANIERRSITLVTNREKVLPLRKDASVPVGITGIIGVEELADALYKPLKSIAVQPIVSARHANRIESFEFSRIEGHLKNVRTAIFIGCDEISTASQVKVVSMLKSHGVKVVLVWLGYPPALDDFREADAVLLAYCHPSAYEKTLEAIAAVLLGQGPIAPALALPPLTGSAGQALSLDVLTWLRSPAGRLPVSCGTGFPAGLAATMDVTPMLKKVEWDFGDGKREKGVTVEHAYAAPGEYTIMLTATSEEGESLSQSATVTIK